MNKETKQILIGIIVLVIAYFAVIKPILVKLGVLKSAEFKQTESRKTEQIEDEISSLEKKQKLTKTVQQWQVIADQIYNDLRYSSLSDNKPDAGYQIARVQNDLDFWTLYKLFGKRREYLFGIPSGGLMDLSQFIRSNLSQAAIDTINRNYKSKNIQFQF